jgi:ABC-type lipoprotein release transport system permease subunit
LVGIPLYGILTSDPITLGTVAGVLLTIAACAAVGPAWRAGRIDPVMALRAE